MRQLITSDEGYEVEEQHEQACSDCPWSRKALPGWLGGATADEWIADAHSEAVIECHVLLGAQCAGSSIYRANVGKLCRNPDVLRLPADREHVFASPMEFKGHHIK